MTTRDNSAASAAAAQLPLPDAAASKEEAFAFDSRAPPPPTASSPSPRGPELLPPEQQLYYEIKPPLTTGDKGGATPCVRRDAQRVLDLADDERHLVAARLLETVKRRVAEWEVEQQKKYRGDRRHPQQQQQSEGEGGGQQEQHRGGVFHNRFASLANRLRHRGGDHRLNPPETADAPFVHARDLLRVHADRLEALERRCRLFRAARRNLQRDDGWVHASTHFGVSTSYRRESDGSLSIRLEGELTDVPLFEQVCVLKEVDLHYTWAPFCTSSMTVADLDKLDTVGWFLIGMPHFGLARDGCFRAIGCDNILEDGTILLTAQGVQDVPARANVQRDGAGNGQQLDETYLSDDPVLEQLNIPPIPKRRGSGRVTIRNFQAMIRVDSPTSATTRIVTNIDPHLSFLPQSLLDFIMKHLAGAMLAKLQAAAKKVCRHPQSNPHARRMRANREFYKDWLMAKFEAICDERGWEFPRVRAFDYDEGESVEGEEPQLEQVSSSSSGGGRGRFPPPLRQLRQRSNTFAGNETPKFPPPLRHSRQRSSTYAGNETEKLLEDTFSDSDNGSGNPPRRRTGSDVVENMSTVSSPVFDNMNDEVSELTIRSGLSLWNKNPITAYLREMEAKTERLKAEKVAESRKRAAARLRPKKLSRDKRERLDELKRAKARLVDAQHTSKGLPRAESLGGESASGAKRTLSQIATARLHSHDGITRCLVEFLLLVILFAMLHPHSILRLPAVVTHHVFASSSVPVEKVNPYLIIFGENVLSILYILLCSVAHFVTCDVAMVYAFGSLRLGKLSGRQIRQYYSENVRVGIAFVSFGIAAMSIFKAVFRVSVQILLLGSTRAYKSAHELLITYFDQWLSFGDSEALTALIGGASWSMSFIAGLAHEFSAAFLRGFILSTAWGQKLESFLRNMYYLLWRIIQVIWGKWSKFVQETLVQFDSKVMLVSWRQDAFDTAQALFSYSAVFLVTLLLLFNASTKFSNLRDPAEKKDTKIVEQSMMTSTNNDCNENNLRKQLSNVSSVSMSDDEGAAPRSGRVFHDTIPEEGELSPVSAVQTSTAILLEHNDSSSSSMGGGGKYTNFRQRVFARNRTATVPDKEAAAFAKASNSDQGGLQRSQSL